MDNEVKFKVVIDDSKAVSGVVKIDGAFKNLDATVNTALGSMSKVGKWALNFNQITDVIGKVTQGFQYLVGGALDFERTQVNMTTLFKGNKEAADAMLDSIRGYAKATSYDTSGLAKAQQTMMSFGLDADFAFGKLKNIGDIAMGDKDRMNSLALAFSQATSTGKLMGQDLMQMINAGFNPLAIISEKTGISMDVLKDKMSKGAISANLLAKSFEWATEEGSQFYNGAINSGDTVAGKIDKIKENIDNMKISLFQATGGATAYIAAIGEQAAGLVNLVPIITAAAAAYKWLSSAIGGTVKNLRKSIAATFTDAVAKGVLGGVMTVVAGVATAMWAAIIGPIGLIIAGIALVVGGIVLLWKKCEGFRKVVFGIWESIKAVFYNIGVVIQAVWENIIKPVFMLWLNTWKAILNGIWDALKWCFNGIVSVVTTAFEWMKNAVMTVADFFISAFHWVTDTVSKAWNWIVEKLGAVGVWIKTKLVEPIKQAFSGLWDIVSKVFDKILEKMKKIVEPIKELWSKLFPKDKFKDVGAAYAEGTKKGAESWSASQSKKANSGTAGSDPSATNKPKFSLTGGDLSGGKAGSNAGTSAGQVKAININIGNMIGTWNAANGYNESRADVEDKLTESIARILGLADLAA